MISAELPRITAKTAEQFTKLSESLKELPKAVADQVKEIKSELVGHVYFLQPSSYDKPTIYLPKNMVTQILDQKDTVFVYAGKFHFVFNKIERGLPNILFVDL